jgi:hypothetical protein
MSAYNNVKIILETHLGTKRNKSLSGGREWGMAGGQAIGWGRAISKGWLNSWQRESNREKKAQGKKKRDSAQRNQFQKGDKEYQKK